MFKRGIGGWVPKEGIRFLYKLCNILYPTPALPEAIVKNEQKRRRLQNNKGRKGMSIFTLAGHNAWFYMEY
jgi:hypothetical protein